MPGDPNSFPVPGEQRQDGATDRPVVVSEPATIDSGLFNRPVSSSLFAPPGKHGTVSGPEESHGPIRYSGVSYASTRGSTVDSVFSAPLTSRASMRPSSIDSEPISAISPLGTEQRKDSLGPTARYFCSICEATFETKAEWRSHEMSSHVDEKDYVCRDCSASYSLLTSLSMHLQTAHRLPALPAGIEIVEPSATKRTWGCGFCAATIYAHVDYLDHIERHFDDGKEQMQWQPLSVLKALLHQKGLRETWEDVVAKAEVSQGTKLRFSWDDRSSSLLQAMLERFNPSIDNAYTMARVAYQVAQAKSEADIRGIYITDGWSSKVRRPFPPAEHPRRDMPAANQVERPSSTPPVTTTAPSVPRFIRPSTPSLDSFSSHAARRIVQPPVARKVLDNIAEAASGQRNTAVHPGLQRPLPGLLHQEVSQRRPLRHAGSDWNLGGRRTGSDLTVVNELPATQPRAAMAVRPTRPTVSVSTGDNEPQGSTSGLLGIRLDKTPDSHKTCEDWLSVTKPKSVSSRRSPSGSSSHTKEHSRYIDNSATESDDSLSEPDLFFNSSDKSEETRQWIRAVNHTVDKVMEHIWIRYVHDWDALINQCVGDQSAGHGHCGDFQGPSPQNSSSSYYTTNQGLMPNFRRQFKEDDEDGDDVEGHRPPSSQSKNSSGSHKRFACPYRKHNPAVYNIHNHDICVRSWETVSRVKEHLYRKHCKVHCQRCKTVFRKAHELQAHEMRPEGCELKEGNCPADITAQQEKQLKSKRYATRYQTEEDKWKEVYKLLFPGEPIPSPYPELAMDIRPRSADSHNSLTFQHFLVSEMPRIFRQTAESFYGRHLDDQYPLTMASINDIITDAINKAFQDWEERGNSVPRQFTPGLLLPPSIDPSPNMRTATLDPFQGNSEPLLWGDYQTPPPPPQVWPNVDLMDVFGGVGVPRIPLQGGEVNFLETPGIEHHQSFGLPAYQPEYTPWTGFQGQP